MKTLFSTALGAVYLLAFCAMIGAWMLAAGVYAIWWLGSGEAWA